MTQIEYDEMRPVFSELWDRDVGLVLDALLQSPEDLTRMATEIPISRM